MSAEVCPFCGKSYKRLKSHLPHCKAAPSSKTSSVQHDVPAKKTRSPVKLDSDGSKKEKKSDLSSSATAELQTESASSTSASTKKKKQKIGNVAPPAPSLDIHKPKKKSLRSSIESFKSNPGGVEAVSFSPLTSRAASQSEPEEDRVAIISKPEKRSKPKRDAAKQTSQVKAGAKKNFWVDSEGETDESSLQDFTYKPESRSKISLQDVKTALGRANAARQPFRSSILSRVEASDAPRGQTRPDGGLESERPSLIPPRNDPALVSSVVGEELKAAALLGKSPPLRQVSSPFQFPPVPRTVPMLQLDIEKENAGGRPSEALARRRLGQVTLKELPDWLIVRMPRHPSDVMSVVQRGWRWYYRKYIDVKKGGVGGLGMLLVGYCVIGYIWNYPRIKRDRWRKFH